MNLSYALIPEWILLAMACGLLMFIVMIRTHRLDLLYALTQTALLAAVIAFMMRGSVTLSPAAQNLVVLDPLAQVLQLMILIVSFIVLAYSRDYLNERKLLHGEYYVLVLFSIVGMMVLVSANHLLTLYLGLELLALPLYALVALDRENGVSSEAAMKYFIMGAAASGMLLYGLSLIYGATGELNVNAIDHQILTGEVSRSLLYLGIVFCSLALAFKLGLVPFHMWVPDVYQGASSSVVLLISSAPKLAAFGLIIRLLAVALGSLQADWQMMWMAIAIVSITLGNVVAISQTNIKRLFGYSAIAHMGYLSLGLAAGADHGYSAALFYVLTYSLMTLAALGVVVLLSRHGLEADQIEDLRGLHSRNPWLALLVMVLLFSMAGIPPTVGFFAKFGVLMSIIELGFLKTAIFALLMAVVGSYYYLRIVRLMYFEEPKQTSSLTIEWDAKLLLSMNSLLLVWLGLFPAELIILCRNVFIGFSGVLH